MFFLAWRRGRKEADTSNVQRFSCVLNILHLYFLQASCPGQVGLSKRDLSSCLHRLIHDFSESFYGAIHWTDRLHCLWGQFTIVTDSMFPSVTSIIGGGGKQMRLFTFLCSPNVFIRKTKSSTIVQDLAKWHTILDFYISYCFALFTNAI